MSGQLVGEVIAARQKLQARGMSVRGFHALIAIAEKCHTQNRQASVPWSHIRNGLYGASKRTAQRAVHDLQAAGVVCVLKPGFGNQHGRTFAPIYEIAPLTDSDTQVSSSKKVDDDKPEVDDDNPDSGSRQTGHGSRHPGVVSLTFLLTGLLTFLLTRESRAHAARDYPTVGSPQQTSSRRCAPTTPT